MNEDDFLRAMVPAPVTCLGVRLRPLSLGSLLLLQRFENDFLLNRKPEAPLGDLLQGILVCSMTFDDAQAALMDPDLLEDMQLWARKLRGPWWKRGQNLDARIRKATRIFRAYLFEGQKFPYTRQETGPDRPVGSSWQAFLLTALLADLKLDLAEALNAPLAMNRWLLAANAERTGKLEVLDRAEQKGLRDEADAFAREVFKESNAS